jgi:tRNA pseudouridine65 synthase
MIKVHKDSAQCHPDHRSKGIMSKNRDVFDIMPTCVNVLTTLRVSDECCVMLEIIYKDEDIVAINKPNGLLVHRSPIASRETTFAVQTLRNQIGQDVFLIHRLDRKTSGVLLFALSKEIAKALTEQFVDRSVSKRYIAIVRGYFPESVTVDHELTNDRGKVQSAVTEFRRLKITELDIPLGKHETSRYSLIEARPETGRQHQIRKHCSHLRHPIIGDRPHGCSKQNRMFKARWNMMTSLLHAAELRLKHPVDGRELVLEAGLNDEFVRMMGVLGL